MKNILTLQPINKVQGSIFLPGSKSISNRVLLLSALAKGTTKLINLLNSDDINHMLNALKNLGINFFLSTNKKECLIMGNNGIFKPQKNLKLFLGNAGTVIRPLTALLSLNNKCDVILTGEPRMKERPIKHLVDSLIKGGAVIEYLEKKNFPPIHIKGGFKGNKVIKINGSISSQFLTSLLIISPLIKGDTIINIYNNLVSKPYIDITIKLMKIFGIHVKNNNYKQFKIYGQQNYISPGEYIIEGDASSASYFLSAAAIKGGTVRLENLNKNSIQGDIRYINILKKMGAIINYGKNYISCTKNTLKSINMDLNDIPDVAMTLAVTSLFAKGTTTIKNIYNWKVKETDRLQAMSTELKKTGAKIITGNDYITIFPPKYINKVIIETYNDHRIAMCFALLSLSNNSVKIINPGCTSKTYPNFFKEFKKISFYN
ncbi:3-phosphoshikimate 1-carboxyvinyltransferase [Enterobacteriaceae endosymbiont of Donacia bicoloricornis]|uniref:3-phosphoshikimate 1-carboxyvinyltransferase n=1 Tax=Enterobacteriaceae endosymbiont of Donacia bicoloricornis TaxID=2675772 RepID=UPI001449030D|nr:3-phosphoshikimate 1-carboxyvinyltransferase [Enterobacteriaceae endosymbiont of Donacia bicoloricornis]QJC37809.1 3-phosphoshikimate 1-carboxyvinyltransferase [Enterobacteriaceae endosymbiont of Donacia bicoloricornis]